MLVATSHIGSEKVNFQMEQYVFKRRPNGVNIINIGRTWEKLLLAARAIAAIEHPQDVRIPVFACSVAPAIVRSAHANHDEIFYIIFRG